MAASAACPSVWRQLCSLQREPPRFAWVPSHLSDEGVLFPAPGSPSPPAFLWVVGNRWAFFCPPSLEP
eukprot:478463-Pyramimonas_sp.AAC.1